MCFTKEQLEALSQFKAEQEAQAQEKIRRVNHLSVNPYHDDLI